MDLKRLTRVLLQRLAPVYVATALWGVTGYFAFMLGGVALAIGLEVAWPLLRPFFEVLYEELLAQRAQVQARRRTELLQAFLPFLQAYKTVLATYPPALLTSSAAEIAAQLDTCAEMVHQVKAHRRPEPEDPFEPQCEDPFEVVHTASLAPRDFRDWHLQDCQTWRRELLAILAKGRMTALRHAVQHVIQEHPRHAWEACLAEASRTLEHEAEHTLGSWLCIQRAQADPPVRQQLATLLRLDSINRQAGLQPYLTSRALQCTTAEVQEIMAYIRYDTVAAKALAMVEAPPGEGKREGLLVLQETLPAPKQATPDV